MALDDGNGETVSRSVALEGMRTRTTCFGITLGSAIVLAAMAGGSEPGDKVTSTFEYGCVMQEKGARDPAIGAFAQIVCQDRYDLPRSAPALVRLVECYQQLRGQPAQRAAYATLAGSMLTDPPPLDGCSVLSLDAAREDLLWRSWIEEDRVAGRLFRFQRSAVERLSVDNADQLVIMLSAPLEAGQTILGTLSPADPDPFGQPILGTVVAIGDDGRDYTGVVGGAQSGRTLNLHLYFTGVPGTVRCLGPVTGSVRMA